MCINKLYIYIYMNIFIYISILIIITIIIYIYMNYKDNFGDYCDSNICPPKKDSDKYIYCDSDKCPPPSSNKCICDI